MKMMFNKIWRQKLLCLDHLNPNMKGVGLVIFWSSQPGYEEYAISGPKVKFSYSHKIPAQAHF